MRFILPAVLLALSVAWWVLRAASTEPSALSTPGAHAPPTPSAPPSPRAPELTAEAAEEDSNEPEDAGEEEDSLDEKEGTGPCIAVEVTSQGAPVPGAHVTAARREDESSYRGMKPLDVGPDGRGQAWCAPGTYVLAAHAPGFAPSLLKIDESDKGPPALARFQLQPGNSVSGRVLDKDSQEPIAQAQVTLSPLGEFSVEDADVVLDESSITTDARGAFRAADLAAGTYRVGVEAPGHSAKETEIKVPRPEPLTLELEGTCHLEGEVVDAAGAPVPGAKVWVSSRSSFEDEPSPLTDAQGRFSLEVEEGTYTLMAQAGAQTGAHEGAVTVVRGGLVDGLVIRLSPSGSMSGRVFLQSTQTPVTAATVSIRNEETDWSQPVRTDAQGTFRVEHLLPGAYAITLFSTGLPQAHREDLHVESGQELVVELPVIQEGTITGRMTDGLGRPAEAASITAVPLGRPPQERVRHRGMPDEEGQYILEGLIPGSYQLEARWASAAKPLVRELTLQEGETAHADFAFAEVPGEVQGTVQRASGGPPRYSVRVSASSANSSENSLESTDDTGHFTLKLLPGSYTLKALYSDTDDPGPEQPVTVEAGKISQVRLTVPDSVTETSGVVLNSRGEPAAGASVTLLGDNVYASDNADAQGHFTLKSSRESVGATGDLHAENEAEEAQLPEVHAGSKNLVVRLLKAAALRGRVIATRGPPVQGFELHFGQGDEAYGSSMNSPRPFTGETFELVDLPVGPLSLQVRTSDGRCGKAVVRLEPGRTGNVEIAVGELGRVTGRLVTSTGEPRAGWVHVDSGTDNSRQAYSSRDGRFEIIALDPGPHVLNQDARQKIPFTIHEGEGLELGDLPPPVPPNPR